MHRAEAADAFPKETSRETGRGICRGTHHEGPATSLGGLGRHEIEIGRDETGMEDGRRATLIVSRIRGAAATLPWATLPWSTPFSLPVVNQKMVFSDMMEEIP